MPSALVTKFKAILGADEFHNAFHEFVAAFELRQGNSALYAILQFRLQNGECHAEAIILSALAQGYLRIPRLPIPLQQFGVKIALRQLSTPTCYREMYFNPLSPRDIEPFQNWEKIALDGMTLIGIGVDPNQPNILLESYAWKQYGGEISNGLEIRKNLMTGHRTPYYRCSVPNGSLVDWQGELTEEDRYALSTYTRELSVAVQQGAIDERIIYSKKADEQGAPYVSLYLTSTGVLK